MPKRATDPEPRNAGELLAALAPASGHLLAAAVELIAAARAALDVLTEDGSGLPAKSIAALRSARGSLDLFASLAASGAEGARKKARDAARADALEEILAALDARANSLDGKAGESFAAVRDAVASVAGVKRQAPRKAARTSAKAPPARAAKPKRKLRRIPIVLDPDASDD